MAIPPGSWFELSQDAPRLAPAYHPSQLGAATGDGLNADTSAADAPPDAAATAANAVAEPFRLVLASIMFRVPEPQMRPRSA
jgi:hypothetical protein